MKINRSFLVIFLSIIILATAGCDDDDDDNSPPVAKAGQDKTVQLVEGRAEVHFSAAGSSDKDGDPLSYVWDFDDSDGSNNDVDSTEKNPTHYYYSKGVHTVTLRVSDGKESSMDTIKITVEKIPGKVEAKITTDDNLMDVVHEGEEKTINFDGSGSSSLEGEIIDYDWDFNFAKEFNKEDSGKKVEYDFESGNYLVALRVTNDTGETDFATQAVKMNYNMSYNDEVDTDDENSYPLPLNTEDAYYLRVLLLYNNTENNLMDLDIYLYYPNGTEANNTSDVDSDREEIRYDRNGQYRERLNVLGDWEVKIKNGQYSRPSDYYLYIDVVYHS